MPESILIIGASARAAAESATAAGITATAIDLFGDRDTRAACSRWIPLVSPERIADLITNMTALYPACVVLPVGGFESWQAHFDPCMQTGCLLSAPASTIRQLRSLTFLQELAVESGIGFPATICVQELIAENKRAMDQLESSSRSATGADMFAADWLLKCPASSAGLGIQLATLSMLPKLLADQENHEAWLQKRQTGCPYGASFLSAPDGPDGNLKARLLGVCRTLTHSTSSLPFVYAGSVGPVGLGEPLLSRIQHVGDLIVRRTGIRGLFGVDLIFDATAQQLWLLEINPRYTASMELLDPGGSNSLVKQHIDAYALHSKVQSPPAPVASQGSRIKRIVWARRSIEPYEIEHFLAASVAASFAASNRPAFSLHDIPEPITTVSTHTPVLTIMSRNAASGRELLRQYRAILQAERQLYTQTLNKPTTNSSYDESTAL